MSFLRYQRPRVLRIHQCDVHLAFAGCFQQSGYVCVLLGVGRPALEDFLVDLYHQLCQRFRQSLQQFGWLVLLTKGKTADYQTG